MNDIRLNANEFYVEGISALSEFARIKPRSIKRVFCTQKYLEQLSNLLGARQDLIEVMEKVPTEKTSVFAIVEIHYQSFANCYQILQGQKEISLVLALDHIEDPRNLGAIARTAAFFGVRYILVPKVRQTPLTQAAVATSQGAFAFTELVLVSNLSQSLEKLKDIGFWSICADAGGEAFESVAGEYDRVTLVLGSEGTGVSHLVKKRADRVVAISKNKQFLDSLNVSVAAGILIHAFTR